MKKIVLQKFISSSGYCSRRKAEELIRQSIKNEKLKIKNYPVLVNNKVPRLGMSVGDNDEVMVNGRLVKPHSKKIYIILNKPTGYVCTNRRFKNEKSVFELLRSPTSKDLEVGLLSLHVAGRLDKNSRGLVLLTNDGEVTEKITHPRYEHEKEYLVQLQITNYELRINSIKNKFIKGVDIGKGDGIAKAKKVEELPDGRFRIILTTGKKRQIRRMFEVLGLKVNDLERVRLGRIKIGDLKEGQYKKIKKDEIVF